MSDSACFIELASNAGDYFTNSLIDDIMIKYLQNIRTKLLHITITKRGINIKK